MINRGRLSRSLICAPAGLTWNWLQELKHFFDLEFKVLKGSDFAKGDPLTEPGAGLFIISVDTAATDAVGARRSICESSGLGHAARDVPGRRSRAAVTPATREVIGAVRRTWRALPRSSSRGGIPPSVDRDAPTAQDRVAARLEGLLAHGRVVDLASDLVRRERGRRRETARPATSPGGAARSARVASGAVQAVRVGRCIARAARRGLRTKLGAAATGGNSRVVLVAVGGGTGDDPRARGSPPERDDRRRRGGGGAAR